jgi:hypothetical protein
MEGHDFGKRALQRIKNYEKGQYMYSYFQLLNIKNVFSALHQIQCIYMTHCLYIFLLHMYRNSVKI